MPATMAAPHAVPVSPSLQPMPHGAMPAPFYPMHTPVMSLQTAAGGAVPVLYYVPATLPGLPTMMAPAPMMYAPVPAPAHFAPAPAAAPFFGACAPATDPSATMALPPAAKLEPVPAAAPASTTPPTVGTTPWLDAETGAVNVRVLLLKSRDVRRKLRAALYHAGRAHMPQAAKERSKAARVPEFEARMQMIDAVARSCGLLPASDAAVLEEAAVFRHDDEEDTWSGNSATATATADSGRATPPLPRDLNTDGTASTELAAWSSPELRPLFIVQPSLEDGEEAPRDPKTNFRAALDLYFSPRGARTSVTNRADVVAVLYRKFLLSAAHHIQSTGAAPAPTPLIPTYARI